MKTIFLFLSIVITSIVLSSFRCEKDMQKPMPNDVNCNEKRSDYKAITDKTGVIVRSRYGGCFAIKIKDDNPIREINIIPCELNSMNKIGSKVIISGNLKKFNTTATDYIPADFDKANSYYLEITKIVSVL